MSAFCENSTMKINENHLFFVPHIFHELFCKVYFDFHLFHNYFHICSPSFLLAASTQPLLANDKVMKCVTFSQSILILSLQCCIMLFKVAGTTCINRKKLYNINIENLLQKTLRTGGLT